MGQALTLLPFEEILAGPKPGGRAALPQPVHPLDWRRVSGPWREARTLAMRTLMTELAAITTHNPGWSTIWGEDLWGGDASASGADRDTFVLRYSRALVPGVVPMLQVCSTEVQRGRLQVATYPGLLRDGVRRWTFGCHWGPRTEYDGAGAFGRLWRLGAGWALPTMAFHGRFSECGRPEVAVGVIKADLFDQVSSRCRLLAAWCFWDAAGSNELARDLGGDQPLLPEATLRKLGAMEGLRTWGGWAYGEAIHRRWVELDDDLPFAGSVAEVKAPPRMQTLFD